MVWMFKLDTDRIFLITVQVLKNFLQQFIYHKRRKVRDEFKFFTAHLKGMQRIEFSPKNQFQ